VITVIPFDKKRVTTKFVDLTPLKQETGNESKVGLPIKIK